METLSYQLWTYLICLGLQLMCKGQVNLTLQEFSILATESARKITSLADLLRNDEHTSKLSGNDDGIEILSQFKDGALFA